MGVVVCESPLRCCHGAHDSNYRKEQMILILLVDVVMVMSVKSGLWVDVVASAIVLASLQRVNERSDTDSCEAYK
jgi:hypothetical protein